MEFIRYLIYQKNREECLYQALDYYYGSHIGLVARLGLQQLMKDGPSISI